MSTAIPMYLQAKDLISLTIAACNASSTATLTFGSGTDLSVSGNAGFEEFTYNLSPNLEMIRPADMTIANYQNEYDDWTATVREIIPANGLGALLTLMSQYNFFRVQAVYRPIGTTSSSNIYVACIGNRADGGGGIKPGKNVAELQLKPCGIPFYMGDTAPSF